METLNDFKNSSETLCDGTKMNGVKLCDFRRVILIIIQSHVNDCTQRYDDHF